MNQVIICIYVYVQCHILVLNADDVAFVFTGIDFFSLILFHRPSAREQSSIHKQALKIFR